MRHTCLTCIYCTMILGDDLAQCDCPDARIAGEVEIPGSEDCRAWVSDGQ